MSVAGDEDVSPSKPHATTMPVLIPQDTRGAHLVRSKQLGQLVLIHRLGQIGDVKVGVVIIGKRLELGVE